MTDPAPSFTWTGTVQFVGTIDPRTTNTATLTLTPGEGQTNLPAFVNGTPGLPPVFRNITVNQVPYGTTPPAPVWTLVDPGGAGVASTYDLTISVNAGAPGTPGTNATISGASDLIGGSPAIIPDGSAMYYSGADSKWKVQPVKTTTGPYVVLPANFNPNYSGVGGAYTVASIGIPALPYAYRPWATAQLQTTGTAATRIDLVVRKGDPATGDQIAYGIGQSGAAASAVLALPSFGAELSSGSTYGLVPANTAATFHLVAQQINATNDTWGTISTNGSYSILAVPVQ